MPEHRLQRFRGGWAIALYDGGRRISRRKLGSRNSAEAAEEFRQVVAEARVPLSPDVAILWSAYREDKDGRVVAGNMEWSGKAILPHFGIMKADTITVEDCRAYAKARRKAGRQDGTIWTELSHLRMVLAWGQKRGFCKAPHIERPAKPAPKDLHLTRDQFERLIEGCNAVHVRLFCLLAIATAARKEALLDLTWDRVDFSRGLVFLGAPNAVRPRKGRATVPMTNTLRAALQEAQRGALTGHVIEYGGKPVKAVRTALDAAARRSGVGHVSPHMFRHSAAVWMAEDGVPMAEIAQYLGHSSVLTTERIYAVFSPEYLRRASRSLEVGGVRSA